MILQTLLKNLTSASLFKKNQFLTIPSKRFFGGYRHSWTVLALSLDHIVKITLFSDLERAETVWCEETWALPLHTVLLSTRAHTPHRHVHQTRVNLTMFIMMMKKIVMIITTCGMVMLFCLACPHSLSTLNLSPVCLFTVQTLSSQSAQVTRKYHNECTWLIFILVFWLIGLLTSVREGFIYYH